MSKVIVRNGNDTYVRSSKPSSNYASSARLLVRRDSAYAYIYFPRPFPPGATITSATLRFYTYALPAAERSLTLRRTPKRTAFSSMTWRNRADGIGGPGEPVTVTKTGELGGKHEWSFNVKAHLQQISDGASWYGWRVETDRDEDILIYSASSDYRPVLEVEWSDAPDQPTDLVPHGGRDVSLTHPTLRFSYVDVTNDPLKAVHVQTAASGYFSVPDWDSGEVPATTPELNLAHTDFPGNTGTTFWRVRVMDDAGLWSEWSDATSWEYVPKGTLTLTSPTAGPFSDPEPTVAWNFTGRPQTSYQVTVYPNDNWWPILYRSERLRGTENDFTIPRGIIKRDGEQYRFHVAVWDDAARVATPGDTLYTSASVVATFDTDAAVPPCVNITASGNEPQPFVHVEWTYTATLPDSWIVVRDGEVIAHLDLNDDALFEINSTRRRWTDRTAAPHTEHRYQVRAVVGKRSSGNNPSAKVTPRPFGLWLLTETSSLCILGNDEGEWTLGEQSTTHEVLGGDSVTVTTQALRGWEGSVSGTLVGGIPGLEHLSAQDWRDRALWFRTNPRAKFRLVGSDLNIPVTITSLVPRPTPDPELTYAVSFNFWEVPE